MTQPTLLRRRVRVGRTRWGRYESGRRRVGCRLRTRGRRDAERRARASRNASS